MSKKTVIILSAVIAATIIVIALIIGASLNKTGDLTTVAHASLQRIVEISELSTVNYTYNATTSKPAADGSGEKEYYVAYEGTVTAGIDFTKISIDVDEKDKKIIILIPEIEIQDIHIDMGTMEYIFVKNKYETETVTQEAYKLCKEDLKRRVEQERLLYDSAKEIAIASVEALFKPWIETVDQEYEIVIQ